jgi:antitoxin component of MazEF toxin-antitoxin module
MLKKLAKYGNSTALVIDKAILEILEIEDGGLVKLQTDGKSLIITPVRANQEIGKVSYGADEAMQAALGTFRDQRLAEYQKYQALDVEKKEKLQKDVSAVMLKYQAEFQRFLSEVSLTSEWQDAMVKLAEQYDPVAQSNEYIAACVKLKYQFCPELEKMDQEMAKAGEAHAQVKK